MSFALYRAGCWSGACGAECGGHMVAVILPSLRCKADTRLWRCHTTRPSLQKQHKEHENAGSHTWGAFVVPVGRKAGAWPARRWSGHVFAHSVHSMHPPSLRVCASSTQCAHVVQSAWQHRYAALSERTPSAARPPQHSLWRPCRPAVCGAPMPGEGAWPCAGRTGCDR